MSSASDPVPACSDRIAHQTSVRRYPRRNLFGRRFSQRLFLSALQIFHPDVRVTRTPGNKGQLFPVSRHRRQVVGSQVTGELLRDPQLPGLVMSRWAGSKCRHSRRDWKRRAGPFLRGTGESPVPIRGQAMSRSRDPPVFGRDGDLPQIHAVARLCTEEDPVVHPLGRRGNQTRKGQADILRCKGCERPGLDRVSSSQRPHPPV